MKIAILTSSFYTALQEVEGEDRIVYGGAEKYLYELCKFLQSDGHNVAVYQPIPGTYNGQKVGQVNKEYEGIPIICLPVPDDSWGMSTNPYLNMMFNEIALNFDVAVYFATFLCWPHVVHPSISISHGIFWDFTHHAYRTMNEADRKEFMRRQLYGFTAPDVCVAVDSNVRKVLAAIEPGSENRVRIIYNFVDTEKFAPKEKDWEGIRVLFPRRLTLVRGCNEFIKASRELPDCQFLAVGQSHNEELQRQTEEWGRNTPNIRFVWKPMHGMEEVYQQADISVVPTRASEGTSLSCLESMSCGLPVITTPVGGLGDLIIDGHNGLVYDPNHENLTDYIRYLTENEDLRRKFGERNREIAVECFDIEIWREKWRNLIKRFC